MCYFTYKFYECNHRGEDHIVKCDKKRNDGTGTHCNPDQVGYKRMPQCDIKLKDLPGLCRPCAALERKRLEDEAEAKATQRDIEKARKHDLEEQRRNAGALETHIHKVKNESHMEWECQETIRIQQVLRENRERQEQEMRPQRSIALKESRREFERQQYDSSSQMPTAIESSRQTYQAHMEESYGEYVEEGSARDEAIMNKSKMDWHHPKWIQPLEQYDDGTTEIQATMNKGFSISESHSEKQRSAAFSSVPPPPHPPPLPPTSSGSTFLARTAKSSQSTTTSSAISQPPPPSPSPMPPASRQTRISASSLLNSKFSLRTNRTVKSTKPIPSPPSSGFSAAMISESCRSLKKADFTHASCMTASACRLPAAPVPAFPHVDYSQPPQEQNYGRFVIGTRHQPIHPSQENANTSASPTSPATPRGPRAPAPAVRLAGSIAPVPTRLPTAFEAVPGSTPRPFRSPIGARGPQPRPVVRKDDTPDELAAI